MTFSEQMYDALHDLGRLVESIRDCVVSSEFSENTIRLTQTPSLVGFETPPAARIA